jgi:DNA-binding CsgD family transcriptional regulator/tetratricopeptide (TPR) repeat protein
VLLGRHSELEQLDGLLEAVRGGESRVLVVRGEPGVGKSALLDHLVEQATGCRVERAAGLQSEVELAFAGLHQLCASMLDRLDCLPAPQRDALGTAFGSADGAAPSRFLVGLAVLGLLSEVAEEEPLLCVVDDTQWLDRESAHVLEFVARRLLAESVALVFAVRESDEDQPLAGLPELVVGGLRDADARGLLHSRMKWPLDERVGDRIVAETRGNPLALMELPRGLTPAELAGGFALPDTARLAGRIEKSFQRRLAPLPGDTRRLLLLAAAEPTGDPVLVWRAAERLGIKPQAADAAEPEELVEFGARVRFRYPLARSAVYTSASSQERREVHRALAEATDPQLDPDRRAWHRAAAAQGPDEEVASELERSAGRAQSRGGLAAAAAFLERAAKLTPGRSLRGARAVAAAQAKARAGAPDAALGLLATAQAGPLDERQCAEVDLLRARIAFAVNRGRDVPPLLLTAAKRLEPLDVGLARETYLEALWAALFVGRLARGTTLLEVARAAHAAPPPSQPPRPSDLLLEGLTLLITEGHAAGSDVLRQALDAFRRERVSKDEEVRWLQIACRVAVDLWDDEAWYVLAMRHVQLARDAGALNELPIALNTCIGVQLNAGEFASAASLIEEVEAVTQATGSHVAPYGALGLAAWQGRETEAFELFEASTKEVVARGEGVGLTVIEWATAQLHNSLGRYEDALAAAQQSREHLEEMLFATWGLVELIEAAARTGKVALAADALERLSKSTGASGTDWGLGIEARSRALLSEGKAAEHLYREAIDRLGRTRVRVALARAHLVYGEWLRREHRRTDAREQLHTAHEMFLTIGAEAFAERTRRELLGAGETASRRVVEARGELTAQEAQVARLARDGLTNPEIGARMFISPSTVQYHLRKVFTKLDINSRTQLHRGLPPDSGVA